MPMVKTMTPIIRTEGKYDLCAINFGSEVW
jgi:hypothetical protein